MRSSPLDDKGAGLASASENIASFALAGFELPLPPVVLEARGSVDRVKDPNGSTFAAKAGRTVGIAGDDGSMASAGC